MVQNGIVAATRQKIRPKIGSRTHICVHFQRPWRPFGVVHVTGAISLNPSWILLWRIEPKADLYRPKQNSCGRMPNNSAKNWTIGPAFVDPALPTCPPGIVFVTLFSWHCFRGLGVLALVFWTLPSWNLPSRTLPSKP